MILHWLHHLPDLGILAVVVTTITAAAMLAPHFGRHVLRIGASKERDDAALDGYKAVMSMIGVVLAFSLVQANGNLHTIEVSVGKEAATLSDIDRIMLRMGKPELASYRPLLAAYGDSLVKDEWPLLAANGERSPATDTAFSALSKSVRAISPDDKRQESMYGELLRKLDDAADLREEILTQSDLALPSFFWVTACALLILGIVLACLTDSSLGRTVGVGAPAAAVALLLAFVVIVDKPFEGETSVKPTAIERALAINARRS